MNISATIAGQIVFTSVIIIGILSYYLGKRKTSTPKITTLIGVLLSFILPIGVIYLAFLVLKNDINSNNTSDAVE